MLRLGLWQWHRAQSPSGGLQNYAYAFQWPLFAVFALGLWWKSMRIEAANQKAEETGEPVKPMAMSRLGAVAFPEPVIRQREGVRVGISTDMTVDPEVDDDEVRIYNAYLARLNGATGSASR